MCGINGVFAYHPAANMPDESELLAPREAMRAAIEAAHKRGLKVTGHIGATTYREAAELGIDNLEHGFYAATDFVRGKKPNEMKNNEDYWEVLEVVPGEGLMQKPDAFGCHLGDYT